MDRLFISCCIYLDDLRSKQITKLVISNCASFAQERNYIIKI